MLRRILCPTDLTVNSIAGVAYGLMLAKENHAQPIIFHSTSFPFLTQYPYCELEPFHHWEQVLSRFKMDRLLGEADCRVKNFLQTNFRREANDGIWKIRVTLGKVAEEIVTIAVQEEVDVIVLSRRKVRTFTQFFSRSISTTVSTKAPCPVLSIGPSQLIRRGPLWRVPLLGGNAQRS